MSNYISGLWMNLGMILKYKHRLQMNQWQKVTKENTTTLKLKKSATLNQTIGKIPWNWPKLGSDLPLRSKSI